MPKALQLLNKKFGRLTVIEQIGRRHGQILWLCLCDCGTQTTVLGHSLNKGKTRSCGCLQNEKAALIGQGTGATNEEMIGAKYGRLTVIASAGTATNKSKKSTLWQCQCKCGNQLTLSTGRLHNGRIRCSCQIIGHHSGSGSRQGSSPTYLSWESMRKRCLYPRHDSYKNYGAKGIQVCDHWRSFTNFLADMGDRPEGTTLGRTLDMGDYLKSNCFWMSSTEQGLAQRNKNALLKWSAA